MRKALGLVAIVLLLAVPAAAQFGGPNGARGGQPDTGTPGPVIVPGAGTIIAEDFADITTLPGDGWFEQNNSDIIGVSPMYFQGNDAVFPAQAGATTAYLAINFNSTAGSVISHWMVTPELDLTQFDTFSFWTRTVTGNTFPDRLEVRLSTNGASTDVGTLPTDVGDFTTLLIEINPMLIAGTYPPDWAQFVVNRADLPTTSGTGRLAFRYWVTDSGPAGNNGNFIGIDTVEYVESIFGGGLPIPAASTLGLVLLVLLLAGAATFVLRR